MSFHIVNLTENNLSDTPEWESYPFSCRYCIYWEFTEECTNLIRENKDDMMQKKLKWLRRVNSEFGNCGKIIYADKKPAGYAQYAPPKFLPGSANYDSGPPNDEAVLISCLFIPREEYRGLGLGSRLLHEIIDELREKGIKAIETFGRKGNPENPSGPVEFYLRNEFRIHKDDKEFPLMRLDL